MNFERIRQLQYEYDVANLCLEAEIQALEAQVAAIIQRSALFKSCVQVLGSMDGGSRCIEWTPTVYVFTYMYETELEDLVVNGLTLKEIRAGAQELQSMLPPEIHVKIVYLRDLGIVVYPSEGDEQLEFDFGEEDDGQPTDLDEQRDFAHDEEWQDWAAYEDEV
jgi:hypothetical protein